MSAMTPEAKAKLSKTIRGLRELLLADLEDALRGDYSLGIPAEQAKLPAARAEKRRRLDAWVDEQVRALPEKERKAKKLQDAAVARFRGELVKQAAYTWLNRLVYLRLLEGMKLQPARLLTNGLGSSVYGDFRDLAQALVGHDDGDDSDGYGFLLGLVFDELALDLPGLFGRSGLGELVPMRWSTLRQVIEALDAPELASCWSDDNAPHFASGGFSQHAGYHIYHLVASLLRWIHVAGSCAATGTKRKSTVTGASSRLVFSGC